MSTIGLAPALDQHALICGNKSAIYDKVVVICRGKEFWVQSDILVEENDVGKRD